MDTYAKCLKCKITFGCYPVGFTAVPLHCAACAKDAERDEYTVEKVRNLTEKMKVPHRLLGGRRINGEIINSR